jgi:hypothetical protein
MQRLRISKQVVHIEIHEFCGQNAETYNLKEGGTYRSNALKQLGYKYFILHVILYLGPLRMYYCLVGIF